MSACRVGREKVRVPSTGFGLELFVLDLAIAFEGDAVDDRVLDTKTISRPPCWRAARLEQSVA